MSWFTLITGILKLVNYLLSQHQIRQAMSAGQDAEIARQLLEVTRKTEKGREIMEAVGRLSDSELDERLRELGS